MIYIASKKIKRIQARQILDSRGEPTLEVEVYTENSIGRASVPSGASKGIYEAKELRDETHLYHGKGVSHAVDCVNKTIAAKLKGYDVTKQREIDEHLITIDGTENKSRLGANAILGTSLAVARCAAHLLKKPLYSYVGTKRILPIPFSNFINGGAHAGSALKMQEYMVVPVKAQNFSQATQMLAETYQELKRILIIKYGKTAINVGDEGGFVPPISRNKEALELLIRAIESAGYKKNLKIALDAAASQFYNWKDQSYTIEGKRVMGMHELLDYYLELIAEYPIVSIEDPFSQDDFEGFREITKKSKIQIVGDDLTVTNKKRIELAVKSCAGNTLLLKPNQIGTLTEALDAAKLATKSGWRVIVAHRSGETNDDYISDIAVGLGCGEIKLGAPCRGERVAKFNRLLRIEEELKNKGQYLQFQ